MQETMTRIVGGITCRRMLPAIRQFGLMKHDTFVTLHSLFVVCIYRPSLADQKG
jgi:hypothetical protein